MAIQQLSHSSAMNPGHDLWIVCQATNSNWTVKLDWLINFQICKFEIRKKVSASNFIQQVVSQTELDVPIEIKSENEVLLISTPKLIPAKWIAQIPFSDIEIWTKEIYKTWSSLGKPSLRVFLPSKVETASYSELWNRLDQEADISLIMD